jgi:hypothetical protein
MPCCCNYSPEITIQRRPDDLWFLTGSADSGGYVVRALTPQGGIAWEKTSDDIGDPGHTYRIAAAVLSPYLLTIENGVAGNPTKRLNALTGDIEASFNISVNGNLKCGRNLLYATGLPVAGGPTLFAYDFTGGLQWSTKLIRQTGAFIDNVAAATAIDASDNVIATSPAISGTGISGLAVCMCLITSSGTPSWGVRATGNAPGVSIGRMVLGRDDRIYQNGTTSLPSSSLSSRDKAPTPPTTPPQVFIGSYQNITAIAIASNGNLIVTGFKAGGIGFIQSWDVSVYNAPVLAWEIPRPSPTASLMATMNSGHIVVCRTTTGDAWVYDNDGNLEYSYNAHAAAVSAIDVLNGSPGISLL